jgi:mannose-6-phosphate isomerase-like protein (cupin superfamily)
LPHGIVSATLKSWMNKGKPAAEAPAAAATTNHRSEGMQPLTPGITKAGTGIDGISWNILGQTYVPKSLCEGSFSWHATLPPGTFVPPHIHPTQDEFIYLFEGRIDLWLDGKDFVATAGDVIKLPMGLPHGIFNKSDQVVKCLFWVSPTRKLYDLFWGIHSMKEQKPDEVVALSARHEVMFLPPPPQ